MATLDIFVPDEIEESIHISSPLVDSAGSSHDTYS